MCIFTFFYLRNICIKIFGNILSILYRNRNYDIETHYSVASALIILCIGGVVNVYIHKIFQNNIIFHWVKIRSFRALLLLNISSGNVSVMCPSAATISRCRAAAAAFWCGQLTLRVTKFGKTTESLHYTITGRCLRMRHRPSPRTLQHVTVPIRNIYRLILTLY